MTYWRISMPYLGIDGYAIWDTTDPLEAAYAFTRGWRVELRSE